VVTNLPREVIEAQSLYEQTYCTRGDMDNRIKEQELYLFADRTSSAAIKANHLRLYFSSLVYVLMNEMRKQGLRGTELAQARCHIQLKLFKIGERVRISVNRIFVSIVAGYPYQNNFFQVMKNFKVAYPKLC